MRVWPFAILLFSVLAHAAPLRVVVDPGHGGSNKGAPDRWNKSWEKHHTLALAHRVTAHLKAAGAEVFLTRVADLDLPLLDRINFANALHADVFLSIHLNATDRPGPTGHETFFLALKASDESTRRLVAFENAEHSTVAYAAVAPAEAIGVEDLLLDLTQSRGHDDAQRLAASIQARMIHASPFRNRGVLQAPFVVLMGASMPAVVTEIGFLNHRKEGPYITSEIGQTKIARALADGVLDFGRQVVEARQRQK